MVDTTALRTMPVAYTERQREQRLNAAMTETTVRTTRPAGELRRKQRPANQQRRQTTATRVTTPTT
eukprot:3123665-Lingulodinium_polyedra.AAC.1